MKIFSVMMFCLIFVLACATTEAIDKDDNMNRPEESEELYEASNVIDIMAANITIQDMSIILKAAILQIRKQGCEPIFFQQIRYKGYKSDEFGIWCECKNNSTDVQLKLSEVTTIKFYNLKPLIELLVKKKGNTNKKKE